MIYESQYWKEDILRFAKILKRRRQQKRWLDRSMARVEKEIFYAFYAVRKLIEAKKISDQIANQRVSVHAFPAAGKHITLLNWNSAFDQLYDFKRSQDKFLMLPDVCNQIIHSYVFVLHLGVKGGLRGIYFASDFQRCKGVYHLHINSVIRLLSEVGSNYPHSGRFVFNEKMRDYIVTAE